MSDEYKDERDAYVFLLYETEQLSMRQIARKLGMCAKTVSRIVKDQGGSAKEKPPGIVAPYRRLLVQWYTEHPRLKAIQAHKRLTGYGFTGSYQTIVKYTRKLRAKKPVMYHELELLSDEEAQVDGMMFTLHGETVYGFVYILAWSRYLFVRFYPRMTFEFFLAGHLEAFKENMGVPHVHRYDNLKSVVTSRCPELKLNSQFLDFARHYGFIIHPCTPYRANEKGRVERVIRDIRSFLASEDCTDLNWLNILADRWRRERNATVHRTTDRRPDDMVMEEKLKPLPAIAYQPRRTLLAKVGRTGFVEFETNRYSVPSRFSGQPCTIAAYPDRVEFIVGASPIAAHPRCFGNRQKLEIPSHRTDVLNITPHHKEKRILQLMKGMDPSVERFLDQVSDVSKVAHTMFRLLVRFRKPMFLSAVREAVSQGVFRLDYIRNLLDRPQSAVPCRVTPQDGELLQITYRERGLECYDQFS